MGIGISSVVAVGAGLVGGVIGSSFGAVVTAPVSVGGAALGAIAGGVLVSGISATSAGVSLYGSTVSLGAFTGPTGYTGG